MSNMIFNTYNITVPNVSDDITHIVTITGKRNIDDNQMSFNITNENFKKQKTNNPECDIYHGEMKDGFSNGKGEMKYADGCIYNGDFKNGMHNGKGEMKYADGSIYNGDWKDDKRHGKGEIKHSNGDVYNGDWKDDKRHGKGEIKYSNGDVYNGDWKDNVRHGKGEMKFIEGDVYNGDFKNGKRDGNGEMKYPDGSIYNGDFKNGNCDGKGEMKFPDGSIYIGDWKDDNRNGNGEMKYADGRIYNGDFKNGRRTACDPDDNNTTRDFWQREFIEAKKIYKKHPDGPYDEKTIKAAKEKERRTDCGALRGFITNPSAKGSRSGIRSEWADVIRAWNVWHQNTGSITFDDHLQALGISRQKNGHGGQNGKSQVTLD